MLQAERHCERGNQGNISHFYLLGGALKAIGPGIHEKALTGLVVVGAAGGGAGNAGGEPARRSDGPAPGEMRVAPRDDGRLRDRHASSQERLKI